MLKETEIEEAIGFFFIFGHWKHFNWEGGAGFPLATPMVAMIIDVRSHAMQYADDKLKIAEFEIGYLLQTQT